MKYAILVLLCLCQHSSAAEINADLPDLLDKMSAVCGDRWRITVGENDMVYLNSKETALGEADGYSFPSGEDNYGLHFRFKIVDQVTAKGASRRRQQLEDLRTQAQSIKHSESKGYFTYEPKGKKQWELVLKIKKAEEEIQNIPEYKYKSVHLSEEYSMKFFIPNDQDKKALQYKKDIDGLYELFKNERP